MAKRKKQASAKRSRTRSTSRAAQSQDAIALLKADHRQVEQWFEQFESARSSDKKQTLASNICQALKVHTTIEEEIFYPAFLEATEEEDVHHEAEVEHNAAKQLIADIERSGPDDEYFDAKVKVLGDMIQHHVEEEEKRDGMFGKARQADMDLQELGRSLAARKAELMSGEESDQEGPRGRRRGASAEDGLPARLARRFRGE